MTKYYAHSLNGRPEEYWQELEDHLSEVADLAKKFANAIRPNEKSFAELAGLTGLLHDLGKYRTEFQEYLKRERQSSIDTAHAAYGAGKALYGMSLLQQHLRSQGIMLVYTMPQI